MEAKEWLGVMQQAADYNPTMTPLIVKYGEILLKESHCESCKFIGNCWIAGAVLYPKGVRRGDEWGCSEFEKGE